MERNDWTNLENCLITSSTTDDEIKERTEVPISGVDFFLKKSGVGQGILIKYTPSKNWEENICEDAIRQGNFSQKSLGSGKTWNELKKEILWE